MFAEMSVVECETTTQILYDKLIILRQVQLELSS
jgi:hypothetical protein